MILRIAFLSVIIIISMTPARSESALKDTCAYLGIFVVDYTDSSFEGGQVQELVPCARCDTLPLQMEFHEPGDFGSVAFRYTNTGETVFAGGIVWMGRGKIETPDTLLPPESFPVASNSVTMPSDIRYYYHESHTSKPDIDYAWEKVHTLKIVNELAGQQSMVGLYLYPPSVGMFDPDAAKIIVFIFRNAVADAHIRNGCTYIKQVTLPKARLRWNRNWQAVRIVAQNSTLMDLQGRVLVR